MVVTARSSRELEKQLCGLHDSHPLVVLGLNSPADATAYSEICSSLLHGLLPLDVGGETVTGNLLILDHFDVLAKVASNASDETTWLSRMPWLVDGNLGPDAVEASAGEGNIRVADMKGYFARALVRVMAKRMYNHDARVAVHEFNLGAAQFRWVSFLQGMESRLPGITGTARSLLASLAFGLIELSIAEESVLRYPIEEPCLKANPALGPEGVEALARWIILRMANARAAMLGAAEREWMRELARRIQVKLDSGDLPKREIYRSLRVSAGQCEETLHRMESAGLVRQTDGKWGNTDTGKLHKQTLENLFIEV
jgi:hypothetical protein